MADKLFNRAVFDELRPLTEICRKIFELDEARDQLGPLVKQGIRAIRSGAIDNIAMRNITFLRTSPKIFLDEMTPLINAVSFLSADAVAAEISRVSADGPTELSRALETMASLLPAAQVVAEAAPLTARIAHLNHELGDFEKAVSLSEKGRTKALIDREAAWGNLKAIAGPQYPTKPILGAKPRAIAGQKLE